MRSRRGGAWRAAYVFAMVLVGLSWAPRVHAGPLDVLGVPMPGGSRQAGGGVVTSGQGFGQTVEFYKRFLKRAGVEHELVPVYRYRGVDVARFLVRQGGTPWLAIHVYRHGGRTMIYVVSRDP
jgi:hypothetical protein